MLPDKIKVPTFLVDEKKCRANISKMAEKAIKAGAQLRPHFKTHHSGHIANWFRDYGVQGCTVSSAYMARYFADYGWKDITIAFPFNPREKEDIDDLGRKVSLNILLESMESIAHAKFKNDIGYFIKIDVGTHRTGINPKNEVLIESIIRETTGSKLHFKGFLAHAGHAYTEDKSKILEAYRTATHSLLTLKSRFGGLVSYGDTPSCSLIDDFDGLDELRPGNFIFYDIMQHHFHSCNVEQIAVCLAAPVVALHPYRNEVVVFGGGVHLSKDFITEGMGRSYGKVVPLNNEGWSTDIIGNMDRLSQEHGIIQPIDGNFEPFKVGGLIGILPIHSCLAADLQGSYLSTQGEIIEKIHKYS